MEEFFEYLNQKGLTQNRFVKKLFKLSQDDLRELIINGIGFAAISRKIDKESSFNFVANNTLSGGDFPCSELPCRIKNIDTLARNSILYADTVSILNPFEQYIHVSEFTDYIRYQLAIDLTLLYYSKPLFDEGIFQYSSSITHVCKDCLKKMNAFTRRYKKKMERAEESLLENILTELTYTLKFYTDSTPYIEIHGCKDILEHPLIINLNDKQLVYLNNKIKRKRRLNLQAKEIIDLGIADFLINPIIDDLVMQNHYANYFNSYYLTSRNIDAQLINENLDQRKNNFGNTVSNSLDHNLPFLPQIDLKKLIRLRKNEGEAFQIYRSSLTNFLANIKTKDYNIKQAFKDEIEPEINKINLTIKNSKKLILTDITKDILVGSTFVSVGLFSHFLPPNIGQIIAGIGGINYLGKFGENVKKLTTLESDIRNNKYFFIWKLHKLKP
jgi:hypothetical protein